MHAQAPDPLRLCARSLYPAGGGGVAQVGIGGGVLELVHNVLRRRAGQGVGRGERVSEWEGLDSPGSCPSAMLS